jgi:hypothetical protein
MSRTTFANVVDGVRDLQSIVKVVGNGECTLHPDFRRMIRELSDAARYLFVLTNGNWRDPSIAHDLLRADAVGLSIDAGTREEYERSRVEGDFDRLLRNVQTLCAEKRRQRRSTFIIVRLMVRPSQREREAELMARWRPFASAVFRNPIYRMPGVPDDGDVYTQPDDSSDFFPRCGSPFRDLDVGWTGNVPLCSGSARQVGSPGYLLGNVNDTPLRDLWNGPIMLQYRTGHRTGRTDLTPVCRGCTARY